MNLKYAYYRQGAHQGQKPALKIQSGILRFFFFFSFYLFQCVLGGRKADEFPSALFELIKHTASFDRSE